MSEDKLEALGLLDFMANVFLALTFAWLGLLGACLWDINFTEGVTLGGKGFAWFVAIVTASFALVTYILFTKRHGCVKQIKSNAVSTGYQVSIKKSQNEPQKG